MKLAHIKAVGFLSSLFVLAGAANASAQVYWSMGMTAPSITLGVTNFPQAVYPAPVHVSTYPPVMIPVSVYPSAPPMSVYYLTPSQPLMRPHGHFHGPGRGLGYGHNRGGHWR